MNNCQTTSCSKDKSTRKYQCPANGKTYSGVPVGTIRHHLNEPWKWKGIDQHYYFCDDPTCDVVYFGRDASVIYKSVLRTAVGVKETSEDRLVCYCFGVTMAQARSDSAIKDFVINETKGHSCACEARNPSGRCCLKDFPID